jgi:hypothetical protein
MVAMRSTSNRLVRAAAAAPTFLVALSALAQGADDCLSAQPLKGYGTYAFDTSAATTDGLSDGLCNFFGNQQIFNDVWFCYTATEAGVIEVSTCAQTSLDTKIAIYAGCSCDGPVVACSDDNCSLQTTVSAAVAAGESYLIRVGGYGEASFGSGTITVAPFAFLGDFTDPATGVRYVATPGTTWTASEALAQSLGGHLVSIGDQAEQDFVFANFGQLGGVDRRIWIGFTDRKSEGLWAWSDGSPAKYTNWNGGEPNNAGAVEHYAEMLGSSGRWNDLNDAGAGFPHLAVIELGEGGGGGEPQCPADLDLDGNVGASDLATMLGAWGSSAAYADINADGNVNAQDVAILLGAWGPCP